MRYKRRPSWYKLLGVLLIAGSCQDQDREEGSPGDNREVLHPVDPWLPHKQARLRGDSYHTKQTSTKPDCRVCQFQFKDLKAVVSSAVLLKLKCFKGRRNRSIIVLIILVVCARGWFTAPFIKPPASRFPAIPWFAWYYSIIPLFQPWSRQWGNGLWGSFLPPVFFGNDR